MELLIYLIIGILSGLIGGLLGIGGGAIIVPSLVSIFSYLHFPKDTVMHAAIGTSLATTAVNSFFSAYLHNKNLGITWDFVRKILPGIILGALLGSFIATLLSSRWLEILFGFFAIWIALRFFNPKFRKSNIPLSLSWIKISSLGLIIAIFSNLVGVGGGVFMIPLLTFCHFSPKKIVGTSASISCLISVLGTSFFLYQTQRADTSGYGYIHLQAFLGITLGSLLSISYGVQLTKTLPYPIISKIFATLMLITGIVMFIGR